LCGKVVQSSFTTAFAPRPRLAPRQRIKLAPSKRVSARRTWRRENRVSLASSLTEVLAVWSSPTRAVIAANVARQLGGILASTSGRVPGVAARSLARVSGVLLTAPLGGAIVLPGKTFPSH